MSIEITNHGVTKSEIFEVRFGGFESLPAEDHDYVQFIFTCFGHQWCLRVFPGGCFSSDDGYVAIYLFNLSEVNIEVQARFVVESATSLIACKAHKYNDGDTWDADNFAKRSTLIDALVEGALVIEVQMREVETSTTTMPFTPENPICKIILKEFMDEQSADVVFQVDSEDSSAIFHAHSLILKGCAPALYDASESGEDMTPIPITNIKPDIFYHMLYYIYGGKVSEEDLKENAKDIIDAADIYQVVNLKLEAEAALVVSTSITINNVVDLLLYSHGKNCALLKEAVIDFIVENGADIIRKVSLKDVPGALFADLLTAMTREKNESDASDGNGTDLSTMRVSDLRKKLHEKGLDIDGSREAMIALLDESS